MGCAMQQEDGQNVDGPKKCENNEIVLPPLPIKKKALKKCAGANDNENSNNYLKQTHSVLVKILESAPILINNSNNSKANNCDSNDKKQCDEMENGKECPKIELCPWKKTKLIVNNSSCSSNENSSNMISQNVSKCECDQLVNSDSDDEDDHLFDHLSKKRKSSMSEWRHNSTDSSESSSTSLSASPPSYTDSGCDDSDHSENCGLNDLCQQFHEHLNNNNNNNNNNDGFFRRSIQQKIQYRPCTKNQQCSILRINRNRCQYCRLKKCIAVGMSRDAVRFGRVPKREKARILAAMQQSTQNRGHQRALASELDDQPRLLASVLRAHMETCEFTREKVTNMRQRARDCPTYSMPTLACPLNPAPELQSEQEFSQRFAHVIRGVIDFAGMIPGFQLLSQDDKFTLLKAGLFDALFVRLICMFDTSINSIICLNGQVMRRDTIQNGANARFLVDSTFNFAERMNAMNLTDAEIGLFCAIVLITPDRPGLRNVELIEKMYSKLKACLQMVISQNRPDKPEFMQELLKTLPDLRTLSTLHTEKLVVFRTEHKELMRQQMWTLDDDASKSPIGSWGSSSDAHLDDLAKSPMGSVSSTESSDINEHHHHNNANVSSLSASAPLLAATLTGQCPIRHHRMNSGSSAEDDLAGAAHLAQNGLTITPVIRSVPVSSHHLQNVRYRKLDSPTDSGIESGNEKHDHHHCSSNSSKTISSGSSSCSSPRSSLEDQTEDNKRHIVEQMPVLKRVLQAPPLYDTNSLMDEAYKPHKKFRAMRQNTSCNSSTNIINSRESEAESCAVVAESTTTANTPPMAATTSNNVPPQSSTAIPIINGNNPIPQQSQLHMHLTRPLNTHNNHQNNYHHHHQTTTSSLSSTHSVLAKSLMEEPRMTPEQIKRSDIIQNYLMRESQKTNGLLVCAPQSPPTGAGCPFTGAARHQLAAATTSVITTSSRQQTPSPSLHHHRYFQSPHSTSSNSSSSSSSPPTAQSPRILELQVDMATATTDAPLNLSSKKSPSPPPPQTV